MGDRKTETWRALRTKEELREAVNATFAPLEPYFTKGFAGIDIGATGTIHNEAIALMEAFARPLWGLVPHAAGGGTSNLWPLFREGIINGTDPKHEEYWGEFGTKDQRMVEQSVLGLGLALAPEQLWEPLTETQKENVFNWLNQINLVDRSNPNNWLMFTVLVNVGFKKVGLPFDQAIMDNYLDTIDTYYLSDGWYSDGKTDQRDYYVPFAMHYYGLIYAKLMEKDDPRRAAIYRERAKSFASDFMYWFSEDGSSVPFGRSLTYRFAQTAFWSALVYAGVEPCSLGVIKGIILRHLRWWFRQPIWTTDGLLSIGYAYPNLNMAENYNAPGSPYWAYKAFLILAVPDDHPFWTVEEEPLPQLHSLSAQPHARMLIARPEGNRHVLAYGSGQMANFDMSHSSAKYAKFVYSTMFGFSVSKGAYGLTQGAHDSMLALSECDEYFRVRRYCEEFSIADNHIYSKWLPWHDVEVRTWLVPVGRWHVRVHSVKTGRPLDAAEGGFAIRLPQGHGEIVDDHETVPPPQAGSYAQTHEMISGIMPLTGYSLTEGGELVWPEANTNVLFPRAVIPTLKARLQPGEHMLVSAVFGASNSAESRTEWVASPQIELGADRSLTVRDSLNSHSVCHLSLN